MRVTLMVTKLAKASIIIEVVLELSKSQTLLSSLINKNAD